MDEKRVMELQKLTLNALKTFTCDNCGGHKGEYIHKAGPYHSIKVRCKECGYTIRI